MDSSLVISLDRYFRCTDTALARVVACVSSERGPAYTGSHPKRALDLVIALPAAVLSLPLIVVLAAVNKSIEPDEPAFFRQARVGHGGKHLSVFKHSSM